MIGSGSTTNYFRGDVRSPEDVFATGFHPRKTPNKDASVAEWLKSCIRHNPGQISDVQYQNAVCMSAKLGSAAIFPIGTAKPDSIYIYIVRLPEAITPATTLDPTQKIADGIVVFDLHVQQTIEAVAIMQHHAGIDSGFIAQGLCAYELFANAIPPECIVCAVKCDRMFANDIDDDTEVHTNFGGNGPVFINDTTEPKYCLPFDRDFIPVKIYKNDACDISVTKLKAIMKPLKAMLGKQYHTTPVAHGLGGKTLPNPTPTQMSEVLPLMKISETIKFAAISTPFTRDGLNGEISYIDSHIMPRLMKLSSAMQHKMVLVMAHIDDNDHAAHRLGDLQSRIKFAKRLEAELQNIVLRDTKELEAKALKFAPAPATRRPPPIPSRTKVVPHPQPSEDHDNPNEG